MPKIRYRVSCIRSGDGAKRRGTASQWATAGSPTVSARSAPAGSGIVSDEAQTASDQVSVGDCEASSEDEERITSERIELYGLDAVRAALGLATSFRTSPGDFMDPDEEPPPADTEHQCRLGDILKRGEEGRWRQLVGPAPGSEKEVARLACRAPHLGEFGDILRMNLRAARNMGLPTFLGPVLLLGAHGTGKTWFLSRLGGIFGVPFRSYSMSTSTLGEGLQGGHPSWRNASPGLVAKTLLGEAEANPIIFVDEFDKVQPSGWNADPYRPFYTLLDPSGSSGFVDEYLGFGIDASRVLWVMAANDYSCVPAPILDRLTVLQVPEMTFEQRMSVGRSIYADANAARRGFFEPVLGRQVLEKLAAANPRGMRIALDDAMSRAAADGRRAVTERDVRPRPSPTRWHAGFR